eukprot:COSAG06_NODE_8341_length_2199_cov_1.301905_5_plen_81_part_00
MLTHHFTTRLVPYPDCFTDCFKPGQLNKEIYVGMQGASEFTLGGVRIIRSPAFACDRLSLRACDLLSLLCCCLGLPAPRC